MRPVCRLMIFPTLYTTLPHNLIKDNNLLILLNVPSIEKALLTLHVATET